MKYYTVYHDDYGGYRIDCVKCPEVRATRTCYAIYGNTSLEDRKSFNEYERKSLEQDGIVSFEGDPPIQWIDDPEELGLRIEVADR